MERGKTGGHGDGESDELAARDQGPPVGLSFTGRDPVQVRQPRLCFLVGQTQNLGCDLQVPFNPSGFVISRLTLDKVRRG